MLHHARVPALLALVACGGPSEPASDCDGEPVATYVDADGDGFGDPATEEEACGAPADGRVTRSNDCDDADAEVHPGVTEVCDGIDQDCNDAIDDALPTSTFYRDQDGDLEGDPSQPLASCAVPDGYVLDDSDCDDANAEVSTSADEVCDGVDNDCDDAVDDEDADLDLGTATQYFADLDEDGFGAGPPIERACEPPPQAAPVVGDCDDADALVNPAAVEVCGGGDEDCDGLADDLDPGVDPATLSVWYADADGDGLGDPLVSVDACAAPVGFVDNGLDCDDASVSVGDVRTWVFDGDADGFGDGAPIAGGCAPPGLGWVVDPGPVDCDDGDDAVYPGAPEACGDGVDSDCDLVDDLVVYADVDADGYGDDADVTVACAGVPAGWVVGGGDCDDRDDLVHPGALETCNGVDDDCDGAPLPDETTDGDGDGVFACLDADDADATVGETICYDFDATSWTYHRNNNVHPVASGTSELVLSNDNETSVGAAVMLQDGWTPPYTISLEFYVYDDDGSGVNLFNSADGIAVMVARDTSAYGLPPTGGSRGVILGTGYTVHLQTYSFRDIHLSDALGGQLASFAEPKVYTHGVWRSLDVTVRTTGIEVAFEGSPALNWVGALDTTYDGIGISAATGGSDSEHRIRNVCVTERF